MSPSICTLYPYVKRTGSHKPSPACCRCSNEPHAELQIAAAEQMRITELRLRKLLEGGQAGAISGSGSGILQQGGALAQVARRAGQMRAHLGAPAGHCPGPHNVDHRAALCSHKQQCIVNFDVVVESGLAKTSPANHGHWFKLQESNDQSLLPGSHCL